MALYVRIFVLLVLSFVFVVKSATVPLNGDDEPQPPQAPPPPPKECSPPAIEPDSIPVSDIVKFGTPVKTDTEPKMANHTTGGNGTAHPAATGINCIPMPVELNGKLQDDDLNNTSPAVNRTVGTPATKPLNATAASAVATPNATAVPAVAAPNATGDAARHEKALDLAEKDDPPNSKNSTGMVGKPEALMMHDEHKPNATTGPSPVAVEQPIGKANVSGNAAVPPPHETVDNVKPSNRTVAINGTAGAPSSSAMVHESNTTPNSIDGSNTAPSKFHTHVLLIASTVFLCVRH